MKHDNKVVKNNADKWKDLEGARRAEARNKLRMDLAEEG